LFGKTKTKTEDYLEKLKKGEIKLDEKIDETGKLVKRDPKDFTRYGNLGEIIANEKWESLSRWTNGKAVDFKPLHRLVETLDDTTKKGIDGIYQNLLFNPKTMPPPPKYIINETKFTTSNASAISKEIWLKKLSKKITKSKGSQMQNKWIEHNLKNVLKRHQIEDINIYGYQTYLTGVSKTGKKIEIFELSNNATKIKYTNL